MKAKKTVNFTASCGSVIKLVEGEDICPKTPLYAIDRLVELGLIEAPVVEKIKARKMEVR